MTDMVAYTGLGCQCGDAPSKDHLVLLDCIVRFGHTSGMSASTSIRPTLDDFGARLWAIRRAAGLNRKTFAERTGLQDSTIGDWERGKNPRNEGVVAMQITRGLDLDDSWAHWLVFGGPVPAEQGVLATDRYLDMLLVAA